MSKSSSITIIPDVHGRPFWKDAVRDVKTTPVVFLGDYLDPYHTDGITWQMAWRGLKDIVELKRKHPGQVTLLLGNHDVHYFEHFPFFSRGGRMCHDHFDGIRDFFMENLEFFDLALCLEGKSGKWLFTHAGIQNAWAEANVRYIERNESILYEFALRYEKAFHTPEGAAAFLNGTLHGQNEDEYRFLIWSLEDISSSRGGLGVGSCVWTDIEDYHLPCQFTEDEGIAFDGCRQIVGHTRQKYWFEMQDYIRECCPVVCTDFGRAFTLDLSTGELRSKMERKYSFHVSDLTSMPTYEPFDMDIWNLSPRTEPAAMAIIQKALDSGYLVKVPGGGFCYPSTNPYDNPGGVSSIQMDFWQKYLAAGKRYI